MSETIAFPRLPEWLPIPTDERPVALRPFGRQGEDLGLEFDNCDRARLVTQLLEHCSLTADGGHPSAHAVWEIPVGLRIQAIVALAAAHDGPLLWRTLCRHPDCGAEGEIALRPEDLAGLVAPAYQDAQFQVAIGSRTVWARRPTGSDQLAWLVHGMDGPVAMATRLFLDPPPDQLQLGGDSFGQIADALDGAMEQYDPLVAFSLEVECPECGRLTRHAPDLLASALQRLWRAQFGLFHQVHRLAAYYHWSEDEIARIPHWRRQAYLAIIEGGVA